MLRYTSHKDSWISGITRKILFYRLAIWLNKYLQGVPSGQDLRGLHILIVTGKGRSSGSQSSSSLCLQIETKKINQFIQWSESGPLLDDNILPF